MCDKAAISRGVTALGVRDVCVYCPTRIPRDATGERPCSVRGSRWTGGSMPRGEIGFAGRARCGGIFTPLRDSESSLDSSCQIVTGKTVLFSQL